jgi:hypothetical protein
VDSRQSGIRSAGKANFFHAMKGKSRVETCTVFALDDFVFESASERDIFHFWLFSCL